MDILDRLTEQLKTHEGFRGEPYKDSVGKITIAFGRNLDDQPLTKREGEYLLYSSLLKIYDELVSTKPVVKHLEGARLVAIVDMAYNLGVPKLCGFKRMWSAIERGDWPDAADEAMDSRWSIQVGQRALKIANMLHTGQF